MLQRPILSPKDQLHSSLPPAVKMLLKRCQNAVTMLQNQQTKQHYLAQFSSVQIMATTHNAVVKQHGRLHYYKHCRHDSIPADACAGDDQAAKSGTRADLQSPPMYGESQSHCDIW